MTKAKDPVPLISQESILGKAWLPIYEEEVDFEPAHFDKAMKNLIREPNINSTVIMRADVLEQNEHNEQGELLETKRFDPELPSFDSGENTDQELLHRDLTDVKLRSVSLEGLKIQFQDSFSVIRRIIPRNPYKDHIINQTCLVLRSSQSGSVLVVYIPHIQHVDETPFYLPPVVAVGILYHERKLSIHYVPFEGMDLRSMDLSERPFRIALRLLQTSAKHSAGAKLGYEKRVNHDLVVPRVSFQNRYIALKKKYLGDLVANWVESTDPKKHVFEDLAVAAFLIEFWNDRYPDGDFEFCDLGCGNGLLVHILIMEGYKGRGIDARARKSWKTYPQEVRNCLFEQIIIPSVLLKPHPSVAKMAPYITNNGRLFQVPDAESVKPKQVPLMQYYSSANLLESSKVCTTEEFPPNTFLIGNHSDELTCWMPLFNLPFMVIPCCSHALSGARIRYNPRQQIDPTTNAKLPAQNVSTYGALVDHVEDLAFKMGWDVEKELLRIPSTRNAAIIGIKKQEAFIDEPEEVTEMRVIDILATEGGAEGWVENSLALMKKNPKGH